MNRLFRKVRGIVRTAATWAIGWSGIGTIMAILFGVDLGFLVRIAVGNAVAGGIVGGTFALIVSIAERRKTLKELSLKRIALWGGIGGIALTSIPLGFGAPIAILLRPMVINGLLGAGFAAGSVAIAKRSVDADLLEGGDDLLGLPE